MTYVCMHAIMPASLEGPIFSSDDRSSFEQGMPETVHVFFRTKHTRNEWRVSSSNCDVTVMSIELMSFSSRYLRARWRWPSSPGCDGRGADGDDGRGLAIGGL